MTKRSLEVIIVGKIIQITRLCAFFCLAVGLATGCDVGGEQPPISPEEILAITQSQNADSLVQACESAEMLGYATSLLLSMKAYELRPDSVTSDLLASKIPDTEPKVAVYLGLVRRIFAEGVQDTTSRLFASIPEHTRYVSEEAFSLVATTGIEAMKRFLLFAGYSGGHTSASDVPDLMIDLLAKEPQLFLAALAQVDLGLASDVVGQMEGLGDWSKLQKVLSALTVNQRREYGVYSLPVSQDQVSESPCVVEVSRSSDSTLIYLVIADSCRFLSQGFEIVKLHYWTGWEVLWSRGETEECSTRYYLLDLDEDGQREILTLYEDESNIWGYAHRYSIQAKGGVQLQTLPIPYVLPDDVLYRDRCSINVNGTFTLLGETYEGDEHVTVYYDTLGDSLALRAGW